MNMENERVKKILLHWELEPKTMKAICHSAWEIDARYVLKHGKNVAEIEKSLLLTRLLHEEGLPVTEYIETADGNMFVADDKGYYCFMHKLKGIHLDVFQSGKDLPFQLGKILASLHQALKRIEDRTQCRHKDLWAEWNRYILPEIQLKNSNVPMEAIKAVQNWAQEVYPVLPRQLIHRDPHMGNFLFENGALTGYIDFDLSVNHVRAFDLCYFALSFLAGNTDDIEKSKRWKSIFADIVSGYEKTLPLSDLEHQSLKPIMLYIELLFVAFWSKVNNVEQTEEAIKTAVWVMENM